MRLRLFLVAGIAAIVSGAPAGAITFLDQQRSTFSGQQSSPQPVAPSSPLFGGQSYGDQQYSGGALYPDQVAPTRVVPAEFRRQTVGYRTTESPGTVIIDTKSHFLYLVLGNDQALRYGVGVGREGFGWKGTVRVGNKAEWPDWRPPQQMIAREAARGHVLPTFMKGGPENPLGARAMYLYGGNGDTGYRIHGTSEPWTIGLDVSSGCIRLVNDDVADLYSRVPVGAKVIVM
jgi:lipoprotein-anchoring transpeptidase ErfK/SrfK